MGIATSKKRIWPFQIDRIGILRVPQAVNLRIVAQPLRKLTICSTDTNAGHRPHFRRASWLACELLNYEVSGRSSKDIYAGRFYSVTRERQPQHVVAER